jgi:integrase
MGLKFSKLDRPAIRKLQAGGKIAEHGITAECLADGDVRYSVNIMVDGERVHRVIGRDSEGVTRTQCEEFMEQARTDARAARLNLPKGRKLALSFAAAADDYMKRLEQGGGKSLPIKRRQLRMYLKPYFGSMRLDAITAFTIEKYKKRRLDQDAAPGTVNRELATLSHLFHSAVEWRWLDRLPVRPKMLTENAGRIVALTDAECDALVTAAVASADPDLWLFVAFGLNTAMRHAEITSARWDQLDLINRRLSIPAAKAGQREQPITPELAELLAAEREMRQDRVGWIFPSPHTDSTVGHRVRMDASFRDAVIRAGLDPALVTPHVMRHTAITTLVQAGVDLPTVQRISGHKTLAMVLRYAHVHGRHIDRAIQAIGRTVPQRLANETAAAITQELHTVVPGATHASVSSGPKRLRNQKAKRDGGHAALRLLTRVCEDFSSSNSSARRSSITPPNCSASTIVTARR